MSLILILAIGMGSALGGILRYLLSELLASRLGGGFPFGTLAVNFLGSLLLGFLTEVAAAHAVDARSREPFGEAFTGVQAWHAYGWPFLMTGFCGGFTTFSTFSAQTFALARGEEPHLAGWNIGLNLALCLLGVALGYLLGRRVLG